jgi:hypothetical protein
VLFVPIVALKQVKEVVRGVDEAKKAVSLPSEMEIIKRLGL